MSLQIDIPKKMVAEFCRHNRITRLSLFGSAIRDDFGPDSDIDVLVEFERDARVGFIKLAGLEIELGEILGRNAELHTVKGLHPGFQEEVLRLAEVQYEQA